MTLLEETLDILKEYDKTEDDVLWCGSEEYGWFNFEYFKIIANVEYESGYGSQKNRNRFNNCRQRVLVI